MRSSGVKKYQHVYLRVPMRPGTTPLYGRQQPVTALRAGSRFATPSWGGSVQLISCVRFAFTCLFCFVCSFCQTLLLLFIAKCYHPTHTEVQLPLLSHQWRGGESSRFTPSFILSPSDQRDPVRVKIMNSPLVISGVRSWTHHE